MRFFDYFPANYRIEFDCELPGTGANVAVFKHGLNDPQGKGLDGPLFLIKHHNGDSWLAVFGAGYTPGHAVDGVFATPNPDVACVVSAGVGYWVDTLARTCKDIPVFPIRQIEAVEDAILFADFTTLAAFDSGGTKWISEQLVSDELRIKRVDPNWKSIVCSGFDAPQNRTIEVRVNLQTGEI
jgi:hypothetical protein